MKTYALFDDSFFNIKPWWMPEKLHRVVCQRSNPRSRKYMINLLKENFPDAEIIDETHSYPHEQIILLYPDSIGLGLRKTEKKLITQVKNVTILNGRKRVFQLTPSVHKTLLLRRFIEMTFLPEILITPFIVLYGIFLAILDKFRGK
ncbi:MAG: hypothetical protein HEEMFOPI_01367 [Holosporales bacterium]